MNPRKTLVEILIFISGLQWAPQEIDNLTLEYRGSTLILAFALQ